MLMLYHSGIPCQGLEFVVLGPSLLAIVQGWKMEGDQVLLQFAGITANREMKLTSVGLSVPIQKTS